MKIARISVYQKDLPLADPYWLSGGRLKFEVLDATFVKLETDSGLVGWGEGTPWGHTYVPAHGPGIRAGIETMAKAVLGLDPRKVELVERSMDLCLPGHLYAKAPIDLACWDISGKAFGLPIADLLGGRRETGTPAASSVSSGDPDYMLGIINQYRELGYYAHSAKVGGSDVERDIARIRHLEANRRPDEIILYDVNRAWTRREANIVMNAVADLGVTFEQPGETLDDIAEIRKVTTSPISVDESLVTLQDACRIAREGIADIFGIKLNRVGGLTKARRIRDVGVAHGIQMFVMATGGSVMADTEAAHLAQTVPQEFIRASWSCQDMLTVDVAPGNGCRCINGLMTAGEEPGLGCDPDENILGDPVAIYQ
ncbi:mandelate racemase/muconate lactonizing enzyme family protein [Hoeflea sp. TYP-13]|uniref:mandelate racemase/muconate lactonizing enzyme family protein n=1 Tax=Hoeflea sp. TYP-13 TaxID=3230023 RepID=UPI0034C65E6A